MTPDQMKIRIAELEAEVRSFDEQLTSREKDLSEALDEIDELKTQNNQFRGIIDDVETSVRTAPR